MNALTFFLPAITLASTLSPAGHQRPQAPPRGAASGAPLALSTITPRQIGPAVTSGRVISIAVHPTDKTTWYVGAACGGVWKTTNNGTTFTPIFDNEASYSIGTITIDPKRPNIVWVGSGENNAQRSVGWGDGVYKSEDGGRSWKNMGLKSSEHIGKIIVDPRNPDTVWVAAQGPLWSAGGERGLYRTTDGGKTWSPPIATIVNSPHGPTQLKDGRLLYVGKQLWNTDGKIGVAESKDDGLTWTDITASVTGTNVSHIDSTLTSTNTIRMQVRDAAGNAGSTDSQLVTIDTGVPTNADVGLTVTISSDTNNDATVSATELGSATSFTSRISVNSNAKVGDTVVINATNGSTAQTAITRVLSQEQGFGRHVHRNCFMIEYTQRW